MVHRFRIVQGYHMALKCAAISTTACIMGYDVCCKYRKKLAISEGAWAVKTPVVRSITSEPVAHTKEEIP